MVMQEMIVPRDTYILARGDYRNHTEKVISPELPARVSASSPASAHPVPKPSPDDTQLAFG